MRGSIYFYVFNDCRVIGARDPTTYFQFVSIIPETVFCFISQTINCTNVNDYHVNNIKIIIVTISIRCRLQQYQYCSFSCTPTNKNTPWWKTCCANCRACMADVTVHLQKDDSTNDTNTLLLLDFQ